MIYVLQYHGVSPISNIIKAFTWSKFSHSMLASSEGHFVEAWEGTGVVQAKHPWENHTTGTVISVYQLDVLPSHEQLVLFMALAEVGKKYDFQSLLGFLPVARRFWKDDPDKWFCSHLVAHACREGGAPLFSKEAPLYKMSPGMLSYSNRLIPVGEVKDINEWERLVK